MGSTGCRYGKTTVIFVVGATQLLLAKFSAATMSAEPKTLVVAVTGALTPDGTGSFSTFHAPALNDIGQVAFLASLAGDGENDGIFRGDGSTLTQIARSGQSLLDGIGNFSTFGLPTLNDVGQVAFSSVLNDSIGGDYNGVFRGDGSTLTQIASSGEAPPGGNGSFVNFGVPALNDAGQVAFIAGLTAPSAPMKTTELSYSTTTTSVSPRLRGRGNSLPTAASFRISLQSH